jgi:hypothetical protein
MLYSGATGMTPNNVSLPDGGGLGPDISAAKQRFYCCGELTPTRRRAAASIKLMRSRLLALPTNRTRWIESNIIFLVQVFRWLRESGNLVRKTP